MCAVFFMMLYTAQIHKNILVKIVFYARISNLI